MITGPAFHEDDAGDLLSLTAGEHPHLLFATIGSPDCCKEVADWRIEDHFAAAAHIERLRDEGLAVFLAPGDYRPMPALDVP